jgi:predicted ATPase
VQIEFERFLPAYVSQPARYSPKKGKPETALLKLPLLHFVESPLFPLIEDLRTDLTKLRYLGPSRAIPRRAYVHYSEVHYDLDEDGGNAAHVLWLRRNEKVRYREESVRLEEAVDHCMELMGLEQQLTAKRSSKIVYQVLACLQQSSSKKVTLADIGFGYSQVLPIVLRGLLADDGALILYEQPEIHLHPSAKARLADLFLAFVESGKRVIVETHSTELINKLQLLTIRNPKIAQQTNVVFVEPSPHGISEGATARELKLRSDGLFEAWPDGFADESERLAREILEESVQRGGNTGA